MVGIYTDGILAKEQQMQGWKIFIHSVRTVLENMGPALRISAVLYAAYVVVNLYFTLNYLDDLMLWQVAVALDIIPPEMPSGFFPAVILNLAVTLFASLWIAVLWHRFVLLSQIPETAIPPLYVDVTARYLGKTLQLALILVPVGLVLLMLLGLAFGPLLGESAGGAILITMLGVLLYLSYRFGLVFPATALKVEMSFKTSWDKTQAAAGAIGQLAVIVIVAIMVIQIPSSMNPNPVSAINLIYSYAVGWFAMMVGISVLTTLYGVYIEGREL